MAKAKRNQETKFKETEIGLIPDDWEIKKLGEIGTLKNGVNYNRDDVGEGLKVVSVKQLFRGEFVSFNDLDSVRKDRISKFEGYLLKKGDLLFARGSLKREGAGKLALVREVKDKDTVFSGFIIRFRNESNNNDLFLNYLLRSPLYRELFPRIATGTTITNLTQDILSKVPIILPSISEQESIVKILFDIDSKIELLQRQNAMLEKIGQTIFKHWFVDFEFPNEKGEPYKSSGGEMIDSELGKIPKGWEVKKLETELKTELGGTPSRQNDSYWTNGTINWINSGKVNEDRIITPSELITEEAMNKSATKLMPKRTTVIAITGATLGQVSLLEIDSCANQSVIGILESGKLRASFIYYLMDYVIQRLISRQTGGAQQHINKSNVNNLEIIMPSEQVLNKFQIVVDSILYKISDNCFLMHNLSKTRDLLLPKLMTGKIRVPVEIKE